LADPRLPSEPAVERLSGAVLYADVSGFTSLTESLAQDGADGPERLTRLLNACFGQLIGLIEAEGGEIVKFGGDALTAVFHADESLAYSVRRAVQAANAMQTAMTCFPSQVEDGYPYLRIKIGIGAGQLVALQVGGTAGRWEYVVAGEALSQAVEAEGKAGRDEVVLSPEAQLVQYPSRLLPRPLVHRARGAVQDTGAVIAALSCYVPRPILGWLDGRLHDWLAILHPMSVLFVSVPGVDYGQPGVLERLHALVRRIQRVVYRYQGEIGRLWVGDKGTALLVLLGAPPLVHEDDPMRAVRCALDLQSAVSSQHDTGSGVFVGVATGHVFAGPVGGATRREYTVMGDAVNLAARLMQEAGSRRILCDYETYRICRDWGVFETLSPMRVKGKAGLVRAYRPVGQAAGNETAGGLTGLRRRPVWGESLLVGRRAEVDRLATALDAVVTGQSRTLIIEGEAGIGKSRLVAELTRLAREAGLTWLIGAGRNVELQTPYLAWHGILSYYFGLDESRKSAAQGTVWSGRSSEALAERQTSVRNVVAELAPARLVDLPLLNDVLDLGLPETAATSGLVPLERRQRLVSLLVVLLQTWARERPLILVLEDAQWLDSLSWELTVQVAQALSSTGPVTGKASLHSPSLLLVVVTRPSSRPGAESGYLRALKEMEGSETLSLAPIHSEEIIRLIAARLGMEPTDLPEPVSDLVCQRSEGNPFFAEELILALREQGWIRIEPAVPDSDTQRRRCVIERDLARAGEMLPKTIHGVILTRVDGLPPERQLTLKVAAVIGRTFPYSLLRHALRKCIPLSDDELGYHLDLLATEGLTPLFIPEPDRTYGFKHAITREVVYQTLLYDQRRTLHRTVAEVLEQEPAERIRERVGLLAYHWERADQPLRAARYLVRAGEQFRAAHANEEALAHYGRALELLSRAEPTSVPTESQAYRLQALQGLGQVIGDGGAMGSLADVEALCVDD
jgi:class 3 adenylate cyclase